MQLGIEKSYEILCKAFDHEAKAILEVTVNLIYDSLSIFSCSLVAEHHNWIYKCLEYENLCVHYHASFK